MHNKLKPFKTLKKIKTAFERCVSIRFYDKFIEGVDVHVNITVTKLNL